MSAGLRAANRPLVNISRALPDLPFPRVGADEALVSQLVASHFLERGLRHFALVGHPRYAYAAQREEAFRRALAAAGCTLACYHTTAKMPTISFSRPWTLDHRIRGWLLALPKPVGVFSVNDQSGVQLLEACREAGLKVPEEVALVGADNDDLFCEFARPPLSSVALPAEQIGYEAAALLDRLLSGDATP